MRYNSIILTKQRWNIFKNDLQNAEPPTSWICNNFVVSLRGHCRNQICTNSTYNGWL